MCFFIFSIFITIFIFVFMVILFFCFFCFLLFFFLLLFILIIIMISFVHFFLHFLFHLLYIHHHLYNHLHVYLHRLIFGSFPWDKSVASVNEPWVCCWCFLVEGRQWMLIATKANSCCERAFHSQGTGWQGLAGAGRRALISENVCVSENVVYP